MPVSATIPISSAAFSRDSSKSSTTQSSSSRNACRAAHSSGVPATIVVMRVGRLEPRPAERGRPGPQLGGGRHQRAHLGRPDDLAVAHQRLAVPEVEAGAGMLVRQHERGSGDEVLAVQVAAVAALEHRVQLALGRRDREAADQRPRRQGRVLVEPDAAVRTTRTARRRSRGPTTRAGRRRRTGRTRRRPVCVPRPRGW